MAEEHLLLDASILMASPSIQRRGSTYSRRGTGVLQVRWSTTPLEIDGKCGATRKLTEHQALYASARAPMNGFARQILLYQTKLRFFSSAGSRSSVITYQPSWGQVCQKRSGIPVRRNRVGFSIAPDALRFSWHGRAIFDVGRL